MVFKGYVNEVKTILKKKGWDVIDADESYLASRKGNNYIQYNYVNGTHKFQVERLGERTKLFSTSDDYKLKSKIAQIMKYLKK